MLAQQRGTQCDLQSERDQVREQLQAQRTMAAEAEAKVRGTGEWTGRGNAQGSSEMQPQVRGCIEGGGCECSAPHPQWEEAN